MATYAIGDIQGCYLTLERLLDRINFDSQCDVLWFTGDLVNRGPASLQVLRFVKRLGDRAVTVLGNHDLHLLARSAGVASAKDGDTLDEILAAPDRPELIEWLAKRPLLYRSQAFVLVHAGLLPQWSVADAEIHARSLEAKLQCPQERAALLSKSARPLALQVLTTIRTCHANGELCKFDGAPQKAPKNCRPWFQYEDRRSQDATIIFGHWSALGFYECPNAIGLDTGCVWGRALTAIRLEDWTVFSEPAAERKQN